MNLAIYGGTFDPIHRGHLEVARAAADEFGLQRVLIVPAGQPPHRHAHPAAGYEHRYRMVALACRADERFVPSRLEAPENPRQPHYSIDTIRKVRAEMKPGESLFFVIGGDAFAEIASWHRWREVLNLVEFIVVNRPGQGSPPKGVPERAKVHWLGSVNVPISSTEIRHRLRFGQAVDDWLTPEVADYIRKHGLYAAETAKEA